MAYETLLVEARDDGVTLITLNRPQALNALNNQVLGELVAAVQAFDADTSQGCAVLTGSEKAFAAGADITYADLFIYTCVTTVLKCKGFTAFRESCGEAGPFAGCPTVLALAAKVGERPKIAEKAGKFDQAPV